MKKLSAQYWACQIAGWGGYSLIGLWTAALDSGWRPSIVIGYLLFFCYSIGATHRLRGQIKAERLDLASSLQERLDPALFFRAGRRHIVNLRWLERVERAVGGNLLVILRGGATVEMSRRQSARFQEALS